MKKLSIAAIGKDQPGIVGAFTKVLYDNACNIEDSSMTILEDQFAMLFLVHAPVQVAETDLAGQMQAVCAKFDLKLDIHNVETVKESIDAAGRPWLISVSSPDQTGIMYHVTCYLAEQGINIRRLSSKRLSAQDSPLFLMSMEVDVPNTLSDAAVEADLQQLGRDNQLDIHAEALEVFVL